MLYRESRVSEEDLQSASCSYPFRGVAKRVGSSAHLVASSAPSSRSLQHVFAHRTSVRKYAPTPVRLDQLHTILYHALLDDPWSSENASLSGDRLTVYVVARRVEGLASGLYRCEPGSAALSFRRGPLTAVETDRILNQADFASAPLQLWIIGDMRTVTSVHGAWGHRTLMVKAGAVANRLWIAAMGLGLDGAVVAGIARRSARLHLGFDGYQQSPMLAVPIGHRSL
jgi:nitroreductase